MCISSDCGPWSATLNWQLPPFPNTTGYNLYLNGSQIGTAASSPFTFTGSDCAATNTLGVQAFDASGGTGPLYTMSYVSPNCGGGAVPTNTGEPVVTGTVQSGSALSTTTGSWTGTPTSYSYQWQDCALDGTSCSNITGATSSSYTVASGDAGHTIKANVTATNGSGSSSPAGAPLVPAVDNFNSDSSLDSNVWLALNQQGDTSNSEVECYEPSGEAFTASGLVQTITYSSGGFTCPAGTPGSTNPLHYKTAAIQMRSVAFTYGTVQVRAEFPGNRSWPVIWLLGQTCQTSSTSPFSYLSGTSGTPTGFYCPWSSDNSSSAEIDIAECLICQSGGAMNEQLHDSDSGSDGHQCTPTVSDITANFHTYELDWSAGSMTWKIDGTTECTLSGSGTTVPSHPMFLIIQAGTDPSDGSTGWPQSMTIAWVHVSH